MSMRLQTASTAVFGDYFISKQTDKSEFEQIPICGGRSLTPARTSRGSAICLQVLTCKSEFETE